MNTAIQTGTTVRMASGQRGTVTGQTVAGLWTVRWESGRSLAYAAAEIQARFSPANVVTQQSTSPVPMRGYARVSRCPNPRDCGAPTCDGSCNY